MDTSMIEFYFCALGAANCFSKNNSPSVCDIIINTRAAVAMKMIIFPSSLPDIICYYCPRELLTTYCLLPTLSTETHIDQGLIIDSK